VIGAATVSGGGPADEIAVVNPADRHIVGYAPAAGDRLVDDAVQAAQRAFGDWSARPAAQRAAHLSVIARWIRSRAGELARTLTLEQGKPLSEAASEVSAAAAAFDYYAAEAVRVYGQTVPTDSRTLRSLVIRQPYGVTAAITTWNYPLGLMAWKLAPALAAGCTVVAKPSELTPLATLDLIRGAAESGLPPGVLNSVSGTGAATGRYLAGHPGVAKISFTGGTSTGRQLLELAARDIKSVTLELGGHSPMIVAADAPLSLAVPDAVKRSFRNAGQLCNSVNRIYVERPVAQEFTEKFAAAAARLTVGPGLADPEPDVGPLTSAAALDRVERHVADARQAGAEVLTGGARPADGPASAGYFYLPTVVRGGDGLLMLREETFGPVAPVVVVDDLDEAIAAANALDFGLVCYLYTSDLRTSFTAAERLEFGTVSVNSVGGGDVHYPYAGWKRSGLGVELGRQGLEEYLRVKNIRIEIGYP
jgi:succinate-semialdehyde dehydrogenase / glutarate-semialdehyde dehydrogenase